MCIISFDPHKTEVAGYFYAHFDVNYISKKGRRTCSHLGFGTVCEAIEPLVGPPKNK